MDYSFKEDVSDSFKEDAASLDAPTEESSLKDKIAYIVSLWNFFCQQPDRCTKPFRLPKSFMVTGEVPANSPVLKAIERWVSEYEWSDCLAVWEGFIEKAETNTFIKMVPNRDPSKKVWNGVTLGWLFGAYGETSGLQRFDDGAYPSRSLLRTRWSTSSDPQCAVIPRQTRNCFMKTTRPSAGWNS